LGYPKPELYTTNYSSHSGIGHPKVECDMIRIIGGNKWKVIPILGCPKPELCMTKA
jgi:hypothetical protein